MAVGGFVKKLVGVVESGSASIGEVEDVRTFAHHGGDEGVVESGAGENAEVASGGVLTFLGETTGVDEIGTMHSEGTCPVVHLVGKGRDASGMGASEAVSDVIAAAHEEGFEQCAASVSFAGLDAEVARFDLGVAPGHCHRGIEAA